MNHVPEQRPRTTRPLRFIHTTRGDETAVAFLNSLVEEAARSKVSDIHFEDQYDGDTRLRLRRHGTLVKERTIDRDTMKHCDSMLRARCNLSLSEREVPLDGKTFVDVDGRMVDLRVSILATETGQSIVMRLLDQLNAESGLDSIAMPALVRETIGKILHEPNGLFLVTGPTGSGKTTTLYACLNELNHEGNKIMTAEDPVEYRLPGVNQVQVTAQLTYARALKAFLRQDPDTILVGEIRDLETANTALDAALTGHLVFSTLHTNDVAGTLSRLVKMGIDPLTLGDALRAVMSQRLVPKIATCCATPYALNEHERAWVLRNAPKYADAEFLIGTGCPECGQKGHNGRRPVIELAVCDDVVVDAVHRNDTAAITAAIRNQPQYETLVEAGVRMAAEGHVSFAEARKLATQLERGNHTAVRQAAVHVVQPAHRLEKGI